LQVGRAEFSRRAELLLPRLGAECEERACAFQTLRTAAHLRGQRNRTDSAREEIEFSGLFQPCRRRPQLCGPRNPCANSNKCERLLSGKRARAHARYGVQPARRAPVWRKALRLSAIQLPELDRPEPGCWRADAGCSRLQQRLSG